MARYAEIYLTGKTVADPGTDWEEEDLTTKDAKGH